jgi:hypothetical protein
VTYAGNFSLEIHCGCDLKCLKEQYADGSTAAVKGGPCSDSYCLYCEGTYSEMHMNKKGAARANWATSVLGLPYSRLHLCTLHAEMRIVEKLLHNHCQWLFNYHGGDLTVNRLGKRTNVKADREQEKRVKRVMEVLKGKLGLHSYEFKEDDQRKGYVKLDAVECLVICIVHISYSMTLTIPHVMEMEVSTFDRHT